MALESLRDPLSNLKALPTSMKLRGGVDDFYWDVDTQYYRNDVVLSPLTEGAYVMRGGATSGAETAVKGGDDPSIAAEDLTAPWWSLSLSGLRYVQTAVANLAGAGVAAGGGDFTVPAALSLVVGAPGFSATASTVWKVNIKFTAANGGAWAAADTFLFTLTPSVGTATTADVWPGLNNPNTTLDSSLEVVVVADAGATAITLTGTRAGANACPFNNTRVTYSRIQ